MNRTPQKSKVTFQIMALSAAIVLLISPSSFAMSLASTFSAFDINGTPQNTLERVRDYASRKDLNFKFPFSYQDAVFVTDLSVSELSRIEFCVHSDTKVKEAVTVELVGYSDGSLFSNSSRSFDFKKYVQTLFATILSTDHLQIEKNTTLTHFDSICKEIEHIQWPNHIHSS
jgi:hypothetical protein